MNRPLLDIKGLTVSFATRGGAFRAVDGIDLQVAPNEVLAVVGESGSGKSVAMLAIMGLLPWTATVHAERMAFDGQDLLAMSAKQRRMRFRAPWPLRGRPPRGQAPSGRPGGGLVGRDVAMVFQEPMSSLNPCFTVGYQIAEALAAHTDLDRAARRARVIELLEQVGIPDPVRRLRAFPHQLSGGMSQRVMIAMALACKPRLLIADEPTTALDVTIQAQILDLLKALRRDTGMALVLITHDLGVVAECADRVQVQYAGRLVEAAPADALFRDPHHPYTAALLAALPERTRHGQRLAAIDGMVPGQFDRPSGCLFAPRCPQAQALCLAKAPLPASPELGRALCHFPLVQGQPLPLLPKEGAA
jgi:dipeptide transport system ATP-binding protein